ncbi:MMPL family transporter [Eikenella sp. S3360]|uniref:MMPL family transporter n=1 Tax=Eikenella glucosivorans TaxID=2766967 RepID=A0ABS0N7G2_9NEIS|nr:MMPL family transporter [Eikenella glucosivorans]MBH5328217.1 MMPL family transporter [Eikenella glucosivorans]
MTRLAWLYALLLACAAAWLGWRLAQGGRLQTDLTALLPADAQVDAVWRAADEAGEKQLNGQILLLVGSEDADRAFAAAEQVADRWRQSGLFAAVDSRIEPDLDQLRQDIRSLGANALPREQQQLLLHDPAAYFQQRAEDAANPFAAQTVPLEDDWLGFSRFVQQKQPAGRLQWHSGNGMLYSEQNGLTWVWLRARLPEKAAADQAERLLPLLADSRAQAERGGYRLLAAGGALFAAEAKVQSERESGLMSAVGLSLTFALLLAVFRSPRVFALALPLGAGMLLGAAVVVAVFGQMHILAVVIGTSLVGMLVDFPLHWLTPSVFSPNWQAAPAMRRVLPAFLAGLGITATGYLLLAFTPLPVLRQTAVFSVAALAGAFAATVLLLPPLFRRYRPRAAWFAAAMQKLATARLHWLLVPLLPLAAAGYLKTDWRDDIRDWAALSPQLIVEMRQVADISGSDTGGRFVLVQAGSTDELLRRSAQVEIALRPLAGKGAIGGVQSLNQWLLPADEQQVLREQLQRLTAQPSPATDPMLQLGLHLDTIQTALHQAAEQPPVSLEQALRPQMAEAWRSLYLGNIGGQEAALVRVQGLNDAAAVQTVLAALPCNQGQTCARLVDKRARLNDLFRHTRNHAAWLKLASFALAWLVLWRVFGARRGSLILAVPLVSAAATVGLLGWLGLPVSLFAMFGLLLVAAVGADYAVYALTARETAAAKLGGILLAALTTAISFLLLAISRTPAVAAFGITVSLGVGLNVLLSAWLLKREGAGDEAV